MVQSLNKLNYLVTKLLSINDSVINRHIYVKLNEHATMTTFPCLDPKEFQAGRI